MRGELTKEIQKKSKEMIGREISTGELRLIAYVQYVMVNDQRLEINKVNDDERKHIHRELRKGDIV